MQIKVDENVPLEAATLLTAAGYDTKTVNEQKLQGSKDSVLIEVCKNESRVLVTLDTDFSDIRAYPPEEFSGIIVLRIRSQAARHIIKALAHTIPLMKREPLSHCLWIVEEERVRIRGKEGERT